MRGSIILTFATLLCFANISRALDTLPVPSALYDPTTGGIYIDDLDAIFEAGSGALALESLGGNLVLFDMFGVPNAPALAIPSSTPPVPVGNNVAIWDLPGPFSSPTIQPVFAGNIVEPGTNVSDLTFRYKISPATALQLGQVSTIPEPSTAVLLFGCLVSGVARRRN